MSILLPSCQWIFELHYTAGIHKSSHSKGSFTAQFNVRGLTYQDARPVGRPLLCITQDKQQQTFPLFCNFFSCAQEPCRYQTTSNVYSGLRSLAHITVRDFKHRPMPRQCLFTPVKTRNKRERETEYRL